jgi:hypothetical protein
MQLISPKSILFVRILPTLLISCLLCGLLTLSQLSGFRFDPSKKLPWEAATLLSPSGYLFYGIRRFENKAERFDFVFQKSALPRVNPAEPFSWKNTIFCHLLIAASGICLLLYIRNSIKNFSNKSDLSR